jgi:hypothetical protein
MMWPDRCGDWMMPMRALMSLRVLMLGLPLLATGAAAAQQNPNPSFNLVNRGTAEVREFFATSAGRSNWGRDRLQGKALAPGAKFAVRLPADGNCVYDLKAVFADGKTEERHEVNVCKTDDIEVSSVHRLRLKNSGTSPIAELQVRQAGAGHKAIDLTQGKPIPPGGARTFDLPDGICVFDLRATLDDKKVREKRAADLCRTPDQIVE